MEPTRSAITEHCSRLSRLRCAAPPIRVLDRLRVALRGRVTTQRPRTANPLRQLITLWLWNRSPGSHPTPSRTPSSLSPTTHALGRYRERPGALQSGDHRAELGIQVSYSARQDRIPRDLRRWELVAPHRPSKPRQRAGLCRSGAEDMFHGRQTQDVVFDQRLVFA